MEFSSVNSIHGINSETWSELLGGGLYASHRWLGANESTLDGNTVITLESADSKVESAVVWQKTRFDDPSPYFNIASLLRRFQELPAGLHGEWNLNCVSVGPTSPILTRSGQPLATETFLQHLKTASESEDVRPTICALNFFRQGTLKIAEPQKLDTLGWTPVVAYEESTLRLVGDGFEDYLGSVLSKSRRSLVRRDRRAFADTGQNVSISTGQTAYGDDLVALLGLNKQKYGQAFDAESVSERFQCLLSTFGEDGIVVRSFRGTKCTGFAMFFKANSKLHALCAGFEESDDPISPYFECLFYVPIEWSYVSGVSEIDYGIGSTQTKALRGCAVTGVETWYLHGDALLHSLS